MNIKKKIQKCFQELPMQVDEEKMLAFYRPQERKQQEKTARRRYLKPAIAILLITVLALGSFSSVLVYAEVTEYQDATTFFEEYGLSTDGLTRAEIKKVYKDITTGSFTYGKTIEVMNTISMEMNFVELETIDPDALKTLWHTINAQNRLPGAEMNTGIRYMFSDPFFQKYNGEELCWEAKVDIYRNRQYITFTDGVLVTGTDENNGLRVVLLNESGNIKWKYQSDESFRSPAVAISDGFIHIIGHEYFENQTKLILLRLDLDGNVLSEESSIVEECIHIQSIAVTQDHYAIKVYHNETVSVMGLSFEGELLHNTIFQIDNREGTIHDVLYHNGRLYVSATFMTTPNDVFYPEIYRPMATPLYTTLIDLYEKGYGIGEEIIRYEEGEEYKAYCQRFTELFRTQHTASLFVLDASGSVENVYTVDGSLGASLSESEDGKLLWQINRIDLVKPTDPWFSVGGTSIYTTQFVLRFHAGMLSGKTEVGSELVHSSLA